MHGSGSDGFDPLDSGQILPIEQIGGGIFAI